MIIFVNTNKDTLYVYKTKQYRSTHVQAAENGVA